MWEDYPMYRQIQEKVEAVARGELTAEQVCGSTTVRCAVGLILNRLADTNPTLSRADAWDRLDGIQTAAVQDLRPRYWSEAPEAA